MFKLPLHMHKQFPLSTRPASASFATPSAAPPPAPPPPPLHRLCDIMGGQAEFGFIEAWNKTSSDPRPAKVQLYGGPLRGDQHANHVARDGGRRYNVRLDTPGGYTHAPDVLSVHNMEKRLFLPNREYKSAPNYDYGAEIRAVRAQRLREKREARKHSPFQLDDDEDAEDEAAIRGLVSAPLSIDPSEPTEAQKYAATVAAKKAEEAETNAAAQPAQDFPAVSADGEPAEKKDKDQPEDSMDGAADISNLISLDDSASDGGAKAGPARAGPPPTARFAPEPEVREYEPETEEHNPDNETRSLGGSSLASSSRAPSTLAPSYSTARSTSSMMSVMSVSEKQGAALADKDGNLMKAALKSGYKRGAVTPGIIPQKQVPSNSAPELTKTPWKNKIEYATHPKFERPTQLELNRGYTRFEETSGKGAVPSLGELTGKNYSDTDTLRSAGVAEDPQFDRKSFAPSTVVSDKLSLAQLRPKDLFMPDPRPFRPLRYVRRSDPRQVLLLCAGACLGATQAASMTAARLAHEAGVEELTPELQNAMEKSVKQIQLGFADADNKAGIGMVFCPTEDPWLKMAEEGDTASLWTTGTSGSKSVFAAQGTPGRVEANLSRRLEKPSEYSHTTLQRAQLRAVCAALEFNKWETEGFNQIVIACSQRWLVRGASEQVFAWKSNGWKLTGVEPEVFGVLGQAQEDVPDQDLWLLLDHIVKKYEEIDCTVRFWYIPEDSCKEMRMASKLALDGALKTKQQPMTVKWKRKQTGRKYFELDEDQLKLLNKAAKGDEGASLASGASQASAVTIKQMHKAENGPGIADLVGKQMQEKAMNAHMPKESLANYRIPNLSETRPVPPPPMPERPEAQAVPDLLTEADPVV